MTDIEDTQSLLVRAAVDLFATNGYDGTSVRDITRQAGTNLGAVTYHFGSKEGLYQAAVRSVFEPFRLHIAEIAARPAAPLDRLDSFVLAMFEYLQRHPEVPGLMLHLLASPRPIPDSVRETLEGNHRALTQVLAEGQRDGTIRQGDPRVMALSIAAQPIWFTLVRRLLRETIGLDQQDQQTRTEFIDWAVRFVRAGLTGRTEEGR